MIKITKPSIAPKVLSIQGTRKKNAHNHDYTLHPTEYQSGDLTFSFDSAIYGHQEVKNALVATQHRKCCFCESQVGHDGDVEHFRPKAACRQSTSQSLLRPGYYWLAYEWSNLFLSCSACNQRHKRNLFPLLNPDKRAFSHNDDIDDERPLFINPAEENPEQYISFRQEIAYAVRGNRRGKATIEALGLNRNIMAERRRDRLEELKLLRAIVDQEHTAPRTREWGDIVAEAKRLIANSTNNDALFAGMVRAAHRRR